MIPHAALIEYTNQFRKENTFDSIIEISLFIQIRKNQHYSCLVMISEMFTMFSFSRYKKTNEYLLTYYKKK